MDKLEILFPDIAEQYGLDKKINVLFFPDDESEETVQTLQKFNKILFKKDSIEILIAVSFNMVLEEAENTWIKIRTGHIAFRMLINMK